MKECPYRFGSTPQPSIDLGLALLSAARAPGQCFSAYEIAEWCGCTAKAIYRIEKRALMKLRAAMRWRDILPELSDTVPKRQPAEAWLVRPNEIPLKQWLEEEGRREGVSARAIYMRLRRGQAKWPEIRRVSKRTLLVQLRQAA